MSATKYIVCHTCKKRLWIGQNNTLYTGDLGVMERLRQFLLIDHFSGRSCQHVLGTTDEHDEVGMVDYTEEK